MAARFLGHSPPQRSLLARLWSGAARGLWSTGFFFPSGAIIRSMLAWGMFPLLGIPIDLHELYPVLTPEFGWHYGSSGALWLAPPMRFALKDDLTEPS